MLDRDGFVEILRSNAEAVPDLVQVLRKVLIGQGVNLAISDSSGTTPDGSHFEWVSYAVNQPDESGRLRRLELFDEGDWNAALARFDELEQVADPEPPTAGLDNAAVRNGRAGADLARWRDFDSIRDLFAEDWRRESHRSGPQSPGMDRDSYIASGVSSTQDWKAMDVEVLAALGDRLAMFRVRYRYRDGFESVHLNVHEVDDEGRAIRQAEFDEADLAVANDKLLEWYHQGEGAALPDVARTFMWVLHERDDDRLRQLVTDDFEWVDHSSLPMPSGPGLDAFLVMSQTADASLVRSVEWTSALHRVEANGSVATIRSEGTTPDGGQLEWAYVVLTMVRGHQVARIELFDEDAVDAAVARFDELAPADPRTPAIGNRAAAVLARYEALVKERRYDEAATLYADDLVTTDRRSGVSAPPLGPIELKKALRLTFDLFDGFNSVNVAVRGEHLVLSRLALRTDDGLEVPFLQLFEIDEAGRIRATTHYDDDDLTAAIQAMEARFDELAPVDPRTPTIENECARVVHRHGRLLQDGEVEAGLELLAPEVVQLDRRKGVAALDLVGREARLENLAAVVATFGRFDVQDVAVRGDHLSLHRWTITNDSGFAVSGFDLYELDDDGRICSMTTWDADDLTVAIQAMEARHAERRGPDLTAAERNLATSVRGLAARRLGDRRLAVRIRLPPHRPQRPGHGGRRPRQLPAEHPRVRGTAYPAWCPTRPSCSCRRPRTSSCGRRSPTRSTEPSTSGTSSTSIRESASGRAAEMVTFDTADWDDALALFDEWSSEPMAPSPG